MADYSVTDLERDYYLGNYQTCVSKATSMPLSRASTYYMSLSYCHLKKFDNVERELSKVSADDYELEDEENGTDFGTTFVDMIRAFMLDINADNAHEGNPESIRMINQLKSADKLKQDDELSRILASAIYLRHKIYQSALEVIDHLDSLKASYCRIIVLITMNRLDLASEQSAKMQKKDELSPITELAVSQVLLANRNPSFASNIVSSLLNRFKPTPLLNNLLTAAAICSDNFEEAKEYCESTLDMDNDNLEALINMIHILSKLKASQQVLDRNLERLRDLYPTHEFVQELDRLPLELEAL